jgi:hypothetical protein
VLYLRFTFVMGGGPVTGDSPATYYLEMFARSMPLVAALPSPGDRWRGARAKPGSCSGGFPAGARAHAQQGYRYVIVAIPLTGALPP